MIHIDKNSFNPNADWLQRADETTLQLLNASDIHEIHSIIDSNKNIWGDLKDFLLEISKNKCWYSEAKDKYSHLHVDHFRPKKAAIGIDKKDYGGYWWLAFDWNNYRVCGAVGNVNKRDKFAVFRNKASTIDDNIEDEIIYFLDPTEEEDILKITFNNNGEVMPIIKTGWDYEQANYTIKNLKLNCKKLKEARKYIWNKCSNLVSEIQLLMQKNNINPSPFRRGQIKEKLTLLKDFVKATTEFSATAKACLRSTGIDWVMSIAA